MRTLLAALTLTLGAIMTEAAAADEKPKEKWTHKVTVRNWNAGAKAFGNPRKNCGAFFGEKVEGKSRLVLDGNGTVPTPPPLSEIEFADGTVWVVNESLFRGDFNEYHCFVTKKPAPPMKP